MLPLSLWLYKAQRVLLFLEHLHVLMLMDLTFRNNAFNGNSRFALFILAIKTIYYLKQTRAH